MESITIDDISELLKRITLNEKIITNVSPQNGYEFEDITKMENYIKPTKIIKFGKGKNDVYEIYYIKGTQFIKMVKTGLRKYLLAWYACMLF
jgi:hypothetical protein